MCSFMRCDFAFRLPKLLKVLIVSDRYTSYMDYCNALLRDVSDELTRRVQSVQNAAAQLVTGARHRDHITPILQLYWMPALQRVQFKIAVLVFQCLTGQAPAYLSDDCRLVSDFAQPTRLCTCMSLDAHTTTLAIGVL